MSENKADATAAGQVELVISRLGSLSTLPCVAVRYLSELQQPEVLPAALAEIIESDPALSVKIFSLLGQQGISSTKEKLTIRQALDKLPAHIIRDAVVSAKVLQVFDKDDERTALRKGLVLHSLAVGCCAKNITEFVLLEIEPQLAYSAGLLHDIGKLALEEAMPKSFVRIVEEAKSQKFGSCAIEQKYLGADHTIFGKRLAQKWRLPEQITLAIWLHHSDTDLIAQHITEAKIAQIVRLADLVARQCNIGQSGSYDSLDLAEQIAMSLTIKPEQLQQIRERLPKIVAQKSKVLGLEIPEPQISYCDIAQRSIAQLAQEHTKLSLENRQLQTTSSHFDFIKELLLSISSTSSPIEIAESFAVRWQKFYQTGKVCVYLIGQDGSGTLEAVVVENLAESKVVCLNAPVKSPAIPRTAATSFAILNAQHRVDWLFEQLDIDFELSQTKLMPLLSGGQAVGAIVFELRYPGDLEHLSERFKLVTSITGAILDLAFAWCSQQRFAEQFAQLLTKIKDTERQPTLASSLSALAEMAGGAAHELNNPLSVISGRAQLLAEAETDQEKKRMLKQIQENTQELSGIIKDLMDFAEPQQPRPARISAKKLIDEAIKLTAQKVNTEQLDIQIDVTEGIKDVFVDSAQIVLAIAHILSNGLESYPDGLGPIKVTAATEQSGDFVRLQISDFGCGMDSEILQKAAQPFFSAKPAGRKRGMGLAYAQRLIQLNGGSLNITSKPGVGTTVTIYLPGK